MNKFDKTVILYIVTGFISGVLTSIFLDYWNHKSKGTDPSYQ